MTIEFDRELALSKLPKCGNCGNLKLLVWVEADLKGAAARYAIKPMGAGKTPQLMVRCNWLKSAIEQPDKLLICDGWRDAARGGAVERDD